MTPQARPISAADRVLLAVLLVLTAACSDKGAGVVLVESDAKPDRLSAVVQVVQGSNQQGEVGSFLESPLTVEIKDGAGMPMRGMAAVWTFSSGGGAEAGSVAGQVTQSLSTVTDNQGRTSVLWRMGTQAGVQQAAVSISTSANGKGKTVGTNIEATALPGPATQLTLEPTNLQLVVRGVKTLKAIASDTYGNAVAAGQVTWSSTDPEIAQVDSKGSVTGNAVGRTTITALDGTSAASSSVEVQESAGTSSLSVQGGNGQTGTVGQALPVPLSVRVVDGTGNPIVGAPVGWTVLSGGGSVSAATTSTDPSGVASVTWTLGPNEGEQRASATLDGVTAEFLATAVSQPITNPATVNDLQVVSVTSNAVTLRWTQVGNGAGGAADYVIRSGSPTLDWAAAAASQVAVKGTQVGVTLEHTWTGLKGGTAYQFGVAATRTDGGTLVYGQQSNQVSAFTSGSSTTTPSNPEVVSDLQVVGITSSSITVRWTQVNDGTGKPAKYALRYGSPALNWGAAYPTEVSVTGTAIGQALQYTFSGLSAATTYQFGLVSYRGTLNVDAVFGGLSNFTSAGTSSGSSSGGTVSSVVASPGSATLYGAGSSKQLSAVALDANGNTLSGVALQWKSLAPSIATVNGSGLVTAQALGTALIVVNASCCTASDTVGVVVEQSRVVSADNVLFSDDFESGDFSGAFGGRWYGMTRVTISPEKARSGAKSMKVTYPAAPSCSDGWAEVRGSFSPQASKEIWLEWWVFIPANYVHRSQSNLGCSDPTTNNKWVIVGYDDKLHGGWAEAGGWTTRMEINRDGSQGNLSRGRVVYGNEKTRLSSEWDLSQASPSGIISEADRGKWVRYGYHVKLASSISAADGEINVWKDGVRVAHNTGVPLAGFDFANPANSFELMGWANSGFSEETVFYLDDVQVFHINPGW